MSLFWSISFFLECSCSKNRIVLNLLSFWRIYCSVFLTVISPIGKKKKCWIMWKAVPEWSANYYLGD